jgi:hypothetical protein
VFALDGRDYIFYHRHSIPFDPDFMGRQLCVDELHFTDDGRIENVVPTHEGPTLVRRAPDPSNLAAHAVASASGQAGEYYGPERVLDNNYATRWAADKSTSSAWLQLDLGAAYAFSRQELRMEYSWKPYCFTFEISDDAIQWRTLADFNDKPATGSPVVIQSEATARYLRLSFSAHISGSEISIFEWAVC